MSGCLFQVPDVAELHALFSVSGPCGRVPCSVFCFRSLWPSSMLCFLFQVPVAEFHALRYNVAQVLQEMENLEKRSILKIQD